LISGLFSGLEGEDLPPSESRDLLAVVELEGDCCGHLCVLIESNMKKRKSVEW
jgi:hypothetical protein